MWGIDINGYSQQPTKRGNCKQKVVTTKIGTNLAVTAFLQLLS